MTKLHVTGERLLLAIALIGCAALGVTILALEPWYATRWCVPWRDPDKTIQELQDEVMRRPFLVSDIPPASQMWSFWDQGLQIFCMCPEQAERFARASSPTCENPWRQFGECQ